MEYHKIINLLGNTPNQSSKCKTDLDWNKWRILRNVQRR